MKKLLPFLLLTLLIVGKANTQTYTPIALSGFNLDCIAEDTLALNTTTGAVDNSNYVLYSKNYGIKMSTGLGLPDSGAISNGTKSYQLALYTQNNTLRINDGSTDSLILATPASYASLSLLGFSTAGTGQIQVKLRFTNGDSTTFSNITLKDWFNNPGPDVVINGIDRTNRLTNTPDGSTTDPSIYSIILDLTCADQAKQVKSIIIQNTGAYGQIANLFAVSGSSTIVSISYPGSPYSTGTGTATPVITGITTGTFSSTVGLKINSTTGVVYLDSSIANTYTVTYNYTNGACTTSSTAPIIITTTGALPVKLVYFNAVQQGSSALLQWATSEEANNKYFEVERSIDGVTFTSIKKVDAQNSNSNQLNKYTAIDNTPLPGNNFYRLKQVDIDDKVSYSSIVELSFSGYTALKVFPNPATQNEITVNYSLGSLKTIAVYSVENKLMLMRNLNNVSGNQKLDISNLAKGVYIIKLSGDRGNESVLFTKQ